MIVPESEYLKTVADLLQVEMDLPEDRVWLFNQKWDIPSDPGLYMSVGFLGGKPFGAKSVFEDSDEGLVEAQTLNTQETYSLFIFSRDNSARLRKQEPIFALRGVRAQQMQEKYSFRIGYLPLTMTDVSEEEGAAYLSRYNLTFNVLCAYSRRRRVEYFDTFQNPPQTLIVNP